MAFIKWLTACSNRLVKKNKEKEKKKEKEAKMMPQEKKKPPAPPGGAAPGPPKVERRHLGNVRVIQRNLLYVIGISPSVANEEVRNYPLFQTQRAARLTSASLIVFQTLRSQEYFGQYGKIIKVVVNRNHMSGDRQNGSASAYITYSKKEDARAAIQAVDGFWLDGRLIRCV
jgi:CCR4-NOT transcription complex subunit 4